MKLQKRENRGQNSKAIYNRQSWDVPNRTRKRESPHDEVRNGIVADEPGTSSHSVKPSSVPARKKTKSASSNVTKRGGKGKLKKGKLKRRLPTRRLPTRNRIQNSRVVDVTSPALASQHGKCRVVFNFRPKH